MDSAATLILAVAKLSLLGTGMLDLLYYRLPNLISYFLFFLFPVWALFKGTPEVLYGYIPFLVLLGVGFGLFTLGLIGGGDIKLLAVCGLWAGWDGVLPLVVLMGLIGGGIALLFIRSSGALSQMTAYLRAWVRSQPLVSSVVHFFVPDADQLEERIVEMQEKRMVPYGVAIASAALLVLGRGTG